MLHQVFAQLDKAGIERLPAWAGIDGQHKVMTTLCQLRQQTPVFLMFMTHGRHRDLRPTRLPAVQHRKEHLLLLEQMAEQGGGHPFKILRQPRRAICMRAMDFRHLPCQTDQLGHLLPATAENSLPPPENTPLATNSAPSLRHAVMAYQRQLIQQALAHNQGNWAAAARQLDIDTSNLHKLSRRLGLKT